jgi:ankyrin repeat protein
VLLIDEPIRFLLASLHVDSLVSKKTTTRLKSALDNLSHGSEALRDAYDEVIERIDGQVHDDCTLAKNVLSWISYARRPLTTKELCHALAVEMGDINFDSDNITDVEDILSVCAGLVTVDEESQTIRLVHYTAQKYLESIRENWHPEAQHKIASTCLTYLCFEPFRSSPCSNDDEFKSRRKAYSLLDYSARYWPEHVAAIQEEICELAMTLLQDSDLVASAHLHGDGRFDPFISSQVTGLHLTASIGLLCLSQELISWAKKEKMNLADSKDSKGATPLLWGIWSGRKNVVELLLGTGEVDVNVQDENKQTALLEAIIREQQEIAQLLLCTGEVDISVRNGRGWTALTVAILTGQKEMVELLLGADKFDVDVKVNGWTPLLLAVREGHKEIVELLLEKGADVEKTPDRVALSWYAVDRGYKDFFEFLLGTSTDTSKITDRWPLLALVAADRHKGIAELLGSEEIDLDAQGGYLNTPLWIHAVRKGRKDLVELLLDAGASVHVKDEQESTALMKAAFYNDKDMVELLIDRGADVHAIDMEGETALTIAAEYSGKEIVKMLLDRGADVNATGDGYPTALMMATRQACEEKIELLLGAGADVNAKDEDGVTALIDASYLCKKEVIKLLLRAGADVQAKDEQGETALMWAAQQDRKLGVRLLLGAGANIHAKDNNGSTALMGAVSFGCKDMVGMLLAKGSDIRAKNKEGSTVLMLAIHCISDRVAELVPDWDLKVMVELLLKKGADVHAKDEQGKTALMWAEEEECTEVADLLRTHMSRL